MWWGGRGSARTMSGSSATGPASGVSTTSRQLNWPGAWTSISRRRPSRTRFRCIGSALAVGEKADAPAAYVRASDLRVERLEQSYVRLPDDGERSRYDYAAPRFGSQHELVYDECGLVLDYPGLAVRVAY